MTLLVNELSSGIVLDHIASGNGLKIFTELGLGEMSQSVVLLMNVPSRLLGKKDVIKISGVTDVNLDIVGLIDPGVTVNLIVSGQVVGKHQIALPQTVTGLFSCSNPRCVTNSDSYARPTFTLTDAGRKEYRCNYCEEITRYHL